MNATLCGNAPCPPEGSLSLAPEHIVLDDDSLPDGRSAAPASNAQERKAGDAYRQMFRIAHDLRTLVAEREAARAALHHMECESLHRLALVAARGRRDELEHGLRVGALCALMARTLGAAPAWCDMLFDATPTHDLGNLWVPGEVLDKPGQLGEAEWAAVRRHPLDGARLLGSSATPLHTLAAEIALNHHEKWDGSGYPAGRAGYSIPLSGRLVAVADFVDALGTRACHRAPLDEDRIFTLLELASGMQFDPEVVRAMRAVRPQLARVRILAARHAAEAGTVAAPPPWWRDIADDAAAP